MLTALSDNQQQHRYLPIADVLGRGEHLFWIFSPKSDQLYRVSELISWMQKQTTRKLVTIHCFQQSLEDDTDILKISHLISEQPTTLFFTHAEVLIQSSQPFLAKLLEISRCQKNVNYCFITEQFPYTLSLHELQQNIIFYPKYTSEESKHFIDYLEQKYDIRLSQSQQKRIMLLAGGHFWLLKQLVREYCNQTQDQKTDRVSQIEIRCDRIWQSFTLDEQNTLLELNRGKVNITSLSWNVLEKLGVISGTDIGIPLIRTYIQQLTHSRQQLVIRESDIFFGEVKISHLLSDKSRQLLLFCLTHQGQSISREQLAEHIWTNQINSEYSDWSLDQVIHRFRVELKKIGITYQVLLTKKNKGYDVYS